MKKYIKFLYRYVQIKIFIAFGQKWLKKVKRKKLVKFNIFKKVKIIERDLEWISEYKNKRHVS